MKRLLDESTDELTRSLLQAGVEHRPPSDNKRQLIVAMGAGGALGLFSSNAFAWLGTTAGKVTAAGVAVGVAGAVFVAGPLLRPAEPSSRPPQQAVSAARPSAEQGAEVGDMRTQPGASALAVRADEPVPVEAAHDAPHDDAPHDDAPHDDAPHDGRDLAREATTSAEFDDTSAPAASERRAPGKSKARAKTASGRKERAAASPQKKKVTPKKRADAVASTAGATAPPAAATDATTGQPAVDARRAALDAEVRLVDDMHGAARRKERAALARLVAAYRAEFPDGQLKKEVADFEASLEHVDSP